MDEKLHKNMFNKSNNPFIKHASVKSEWNKLLISEQVSSYVEMSFDNTPSQVRNPSNNAHDA